MPATCTLSTTRRDNRYIIFVLLSVILYLPSSFLRWPFYPDEIRNLYIARHIHHLKDFFFPTYLGHIYYGKPPFYFWLLHLLSWGPLRSALVFSVLLNVFISSIILSVNYVFFKREGLKEIGFLSSLLLATTGIFYAMSIIVRMDLLFLLFIFSALYFIWGALKEGRRKYSLFSALFIFLATFTKGALGVIFPFFLGVGLAVFLRSKEAWKQMCRIVIFAMGSIFLWLVGASLIDHSYFKHMLFEQTILRGVHPFNHKEPFYYYLLFLPPVFLPYSFLGIGWFWEAGQMKELWERWFFLWFVGGLLILSLIGSKIPMYLLLLSVPFCGLTAKFIYTTNRSLRNTLFYLTLIFMLAMVLLGAIYGYIRYGVTAPLICLVFFLSIAGGAFMMRKRYSLQVKIAFAVWCVFLEMMNVLYVPLASRHSLYNRIFYFLKNQVKRIDKVYVDDKKLVYLNMYPLKGKVIYVQDKDLRQLPRGSRYLFISKKSSDSLRVLRRIKDFYILENDHHPY